MAFQFPDWFGLQTVVCSLSVTPFNNFPMSLVSTEAVLDWCDKI